jgi:hypothetical protein
VQKKSDSRIQEVDIMEKKNGENRKQKSEVESVK